MNYLASYTGFNKISRYLEILDYFLGGHRVY